MKNTKYFLTTILLFLLATQAVAKRKKARKKVSTAHSFEVRYGANSWNLDSSKIDNAKIIVTDDQSGKMVQITLEETEPDSSIFSGFFKINWPGIKAISPNVYIPPENIRYDENLIDKMNQLINSRQLTRKPFIFKRNKNTRLIEVFDTKTQAKVALKYYREEIRLKKASTIKLKPSAKKTILSKSSIDMSEVAKLALAKKQRALEAIKLASERLRLRQIEQQKELQRKKKQDELNKAEILARKNKGKKIAALAMKKYLAGEYQKAVILFEESIYLDPNNKSYYYQLGVSLYKTGQYNRSIVVLKSIKKKKLHLIEKNYFLGLNYFRLNELNNALKKFSKVKSYNDKQLSASAAFYEGLIKFNQKKYLAAKPSFEYVLDNSVDPKLDERAESYIELITRTLYFEKQQKTNIFLSGTIGLEYDSNILFSADSAQDQGTATNQGGGRALAISSIKWRPIYSQKHDFSVDTDLLYYYSFDSSFNRADPFMGTLSLPYSYKSTMFGKGYKLDLSPGYETLFLDANDEGSRKNILSSILLDIDNTFVMNPTWFSLYTLKLRSDDSKLTVTDAADNSSTTKITAGTTQTYLLNNAKTKIFIGEFDFTLNNATGDNNVYNRVDLKTSYILPLNIFSQNITWINSFSYYLANYTKRSDNRKDNNLALSITFSKQLKDWLSMSLISTYTNNLSNVSDFQYNKFSIMTTFSFDTAF